MKTKRIVITLILAAGLPAIATAQSTGEAQKQQAQERLQKMKDRLQLTPEQVEKVRPIFAEEMEQLRALREKAQGDQSRRGRMRLAREAKDIQKTADQKLKQILTKKQMDELKKIRAENREQLRERARER